MVNVYDSTGTILAECNSRGDQFVCGYNGPTGVANPCREYLESATEESLHLRLRLHQSSGLTLEDGDWGEEVADMFAQHCAGANAKHCDNPVSVETLICRKALDVPGGHALYFKWTGPSRQRLSPCSTWDEYDNATARTR